MSEYINFNETSIANLKKAEDMNNNDYFLIQPQDFNNQAMILPYKNLIIGLDNVSFATTITNLVKKCDELQTQIDALSAKIKNQIND